jgi:hypothetical protein
MSPVGAAYSIIFSSQQQIIFANWIIFRIFAVAFL